MRDEQLHGVVTELLGKRWSLEQVAHELRLHFPGQPERHLCTESIYQAIYDPRTDLAVGTLVERTTRFVMLIHVRIGRPTAAAMRDGITDALGALMPHRRRTLTWDQGKELALHHQIAAMTGTRVYFCDAHSPWQRGSNENTNALLPDYFPKNADLSTISLEELQRVADELNDRPRKTLDWRRPGWSGWRGWRIRTPLTTRRAESSGPFPVVPLAG